MILLIYSVRRRKHIRSVLIRAHKEEEHHTIHVKDNRVKPLARIMNLLEEVTIGKLHDAVRHQRGRLIHKDIAGKMQYNSYDFSSGRCFNTAPFCESFGIQFDGATRTCTQSSTLKIFDFVFGSTITQGTKMVIDRAIDETIHILDKLGPAGRFLGDVVKADAVMSGAVTCAICTIFTNDVKILMDVFTGNFNDIENRLKSNIQQVKKAVDAVCGFFKAIAHDFFALF
jgi:hypothetical protein